MPGLRFAVFLLLLTVCSCAEEGGNCELMRDFSPQCGGWAELGHCDQASMYSNQARELCPSSCNGCGLNFLAKDSCRTVTDNFSTCRLWSLSGHCSYLNEHYGYMQEQCPFSCAGCAPPNLYPEGEECARLHDYNADNCVKWAEEGLCLDDAHVAKFMREQCSYSCHGCLKEICAVARDETDYCSEYKYRGWCQPRNHYYRQIISDCEATCNDCV